ncbi:MAG: hydrolase [Clostridia bacterium]|nr:hydrolase [Clostridia bacterium]
MMDLEVNILRGEENIGENLIEVSDGKNIILIECGAALNPTEKTKEIEQRVLATHYDAIIISHSHLDHAGLLKSEVNTDAIYMGKSTYELLCFTDTICLQNRNRVRLFENNESFLVGEIEMKPYLCDHSAYDSYMIEIKKGNRSILYTGDFRSNGRKSFNALLQRLPSKVDALITEATNPYEYTHTERYLEDKATEIMKKHKRVFFLQSRLNIDRLVSFYRATRRTGKPFIMGLDSAEISRMGKNIPSPLRFDDCYTYLRHRVSNFDYTSSKDVYKQKLIGRRDIARMDEFSMQVMAGMDDYLERLAELTDLRGSALIYSMWHGYKESENMKEFLKKAEALGVEIIDLHVSGHADKATQKRLIERVSPGKIITVHKDSKADG